MLDRQFTGREPVSELLIYRQVSGAAEFLAQALHWSREIFGDETQGIIRVPQVEAEESFAVDQIVSVGFPRCNIVDPDNLVLRMFDMWSPRQFNDAGRFRFAARRAVAVAEKVYSPIQKESDTGKEKFRTSSLYQALDSIGHEFDIFDQTDVPIRVAGVEQVDMATGSKRIELGLGLHPTDRATTMLLRQSRMCLTALGMHSKRVAYPATTLHVDIPFASLPADTTPQDGNEFVGRIVPYLEGLNLRLGGVLASPDLD